MEVSHVPQTPHVEKHFTGSNTVRDIVIGMSDGLTVPFALAAGLSGAVESTRVIITAGSAEIAAEAMATTVAHASRRDRRRWVNFMMKFELGLERPDPLRARASAMSIGLSYIAGGLVPLAPYFFIKAPAAGLLVSVVLTLLALLLFGYVKGSLTVR